MYACEFDFDKYGNKWLFVLSICLHPCLLNITLNVNDNFPYLVPRTARSRRTAPRQRRRAPGDSYVAWAETWQRLQQPCLTPGARLQAQLDSTSLQAYLHAARSGRNPRELQLSNHFLNKQTNERSSKNKQRAGPLLTNNTLYTRELIEPKCRYIFLPYDNVWLKITLRVDRLCFLM